MPVNKKKVNVNYVNSDLFVNGESLVFPSSWNFLIGGAREQEA